jgi:hypothetical protein
MTLRSGAELTLDADAIGCRTRCPRCLNVGVIEDVCTSGLADVTKGAVIIRHPDDVVWHVMKPGEAAAINWDACLLK